MDSAAFAAQRKEELSAVDEQLQPHVEDALHGLLVGDDDWADGLVLAASSAWLDIFDAEAPEGGKRGLALARFRKDLIAALELTGAPQMDVTQGQIDRMTYWLSGYVVNSATHAAIFASGKRFSRWVSMRDKDVREVHRPVDGQIRPIGGTFDVGDSKLHYPGEPVGDPGNWIQCRCVLQPAARPGGAMSSTTYTIGPDDDVEDDNPDIVPGSDIFAMTPDPFPNEEEGDGIHVDTDVDTEPIPIEEDEDEDEELTELPVHGVLAPEGVATGDGRMFALGALSTRELPIPLRAEILSTHGGTTSDVVTIGRVDEAWRDDASNSWRWRGAVVLDKPHAQETIAGILDGTVRGVSIDGDAAEIDDSTFDESENGDFLTVFSKMRAAGLTIVPIPAFQEAYVGMGHEFTEDASTEELALLASCGCSDTSAPGIAGYNAEDEFRDFPPAEREGSADAGHALPDGSFPIENVDDLKNAIQAIGRAKDPEAAKAHIKKRARELGAEDLIPEDWGAGVVEFEVDGIIPFVPEPYTYAPGTHDGPGWITNPGATARLRRYWTHGEGAAKIAWGTGGDFNRCRSQLAKYVQNPDWLAGLCANMHYEALGIWPATHAKATKGSAAPIIASAKTVYPAEWFQNPGLDHAAPVRIEGNRIFGYLAQWGVCHVGVEGICRDAPHSHSDYAYWRKGEVDTDRGVQRVGTLSLGEGPRKGHASPYARMSAAVAHYDDPQSVKAFMNIGEDATGVWVAGVMVPWATEKDYALIRGTGAISGDWRSWTGDPNDLELIGIASVVVPGFQLAASAGMIGTNVMPAPEPVLTASANVTERLNAELIGAITRNAVEEYRHQEKVTASVAPHRDRIRLARLSNARARLERTDHGM